MSSHVNLWASLISILGILVFAFWLYRDYRLDLLRQQMFSLRDQLFDEAVKGQISFEHPAYRMLRTTMNGVVRFAHRINLFHTIALILILRKQQGQLPPSFSDRFKHHLEDLTEQQKDLVNKYLLSMNLLIASHIVRSSPVSTVLVLVMAFFTININRLVEVLKHRLEEIDSMVLTESEAYFSQPQGQRAELRSFN